MSVDERLRAALHEQAETCSPDVDTALDDVRRRGRRVRLRSRGLAVAGAAAAVGAVVWMPYPGQERRLPADDPSRSVVTTDRPANAVPLRGRISAAVPAPPELAGTWVLQLNGNATMDVTPPPGYPGDLGGAFFTADRATFRTTLFGAGVCAGDGTGIYRWLAVGDRVEFEAVSDPCAARQRFFESSPWLVSTAAGARG